MKKKDFEALSVNEQKEKINELITSWCEQDSDNRCAIVILGDRKDEEDAGKSSCGMIGPRKLLLASLASSLDHNEDLKGFAACSLLGPLGAMFNTSKEEE